MTLLIINPKDSMKKSPKKPLMKYSKLIKKIDDIRPSKRTPVQEKIINEEYIRRRELYDSVLNSKKTDV